MIAITVCVILLISLVATISLVVKKPFAIPVRVIFLFLSVIVFLVSCLLCLIMIDGYRIGRGAELFLSEILSFSEKQIAFSPDVDINEKERIQAIISELVKIENVQIQHYDVFGDSWEYILVCNNKPDYFVMIEAPGTFFRLFAPVNYTLRDIREYIPGPDILSGRQRD